MPSRGTLVVSADGQERTLRAYHIVIAVGSSATIPSIDGIESITPWTNREATSARALPESLVILGAGHHQEGPHPGVSDVARRQAASRRG